MHKERFKEKPISDIFHSGLSYCFEKIAEGIHTSSGAGRVFALIHLKMIHEIYDNFKGSLKERNELNENIKDDIDEYKHAMARLEKYLESESNSMKEPDAYIYYFYLREKNESFIEIAKGIDDQYQDKE